MRVAAVQHDIVWEDAAATQALVAPMIADAAGQGARLVVLPEMFATGFSMRPERTAEPEGGPIETFLLEQARHHDAYLIASIAQRSPDGAHRNNAVVAHPDGRVERYAKIHPFTYSGEHEHYTAGTDFLTVTLDDVRTSVFVCYDLRFADEFWALANGTDLYVVPANWPSTRTAHWTALLRARAIENQAYVLGVNRVGTGGRLDYAGASMLIDPLGGVRFAGGSEPAVLAADVFPADVLSARTKFPFLVDRR
ncbi:MAG: carbon-nitrogen family hydrolase [Jatrophihabitans sp.]|uniref:carbon-nitrogen family hydrolase n=1 Tax=Jatrophihabitans sp. TaxID=1932789 RepID=UPI003F7E555E